ncbi:MAG: hypothetical protein EOO27_20240 [Comamonadaceae bacterium]|nr:MAG: hypothetical protein EOO27_20240 [Comamonadaceae bacterium]
MARLDSDEFAQKLVQAVNADTRFAREAQWFDGSILLEDGSSRLWLKIYKGQVIDHMPFVPPIGFTFKVTGPSEAWDELVDGKKFTDLVLAGTRRFQGVESVVDGAGLRPGRITFEGNLMEAHRVIEAIYLISEAYASTAQSQGAAA